MKKCPNPACDPAYLFGDDRQVCPFCHSVLVSSREEETGPLLRPADRLHSDAVHPDAPQITFLQRRGDKIECHGRVTELEHQELFNSTGLKLFNTLFRGEPYQLAHQTIEYAIRVESLSEDIPAEVCDFCLFGSYLGRMQVGDEVVIQAKDRKDRRVITGIENRTTGTVIRPGFQFPPALVRAVFLLLAVLPVVLVCQLVWLVRSGAVAALISSVLAALLPVGFLLFLLWSIVRSMFKRR